jgi:hypothetical protein
MSSSSYQKVPQLPLRLCTVQPSKLQSPAPHLAKYVTSSGGCQLLLRLVWMRRFVAFKVQTGTRVCRSFTVRSNDFRFSWTVSRGEIRSIKVIARNQSYWRDDTKGFYDVETEAWLTVLRCNGLVVTRSSDCDTDTKSDEFELPIGCGRRLGEALLCNTWMDDLTLRVSELVAAKDIDIPGIQTDGDYPYSTEERKKMSDEMENILTPLLQYLSTCTVLKVLLTMEMDVSTNNLM